MTDTTTTERAREILVRWRKRIGCEIPELDLWVQEHYPALIECIAQALVEARREGAKAEWNEALNAVNAISVVGFRAGFLREFAQKRLSELAGGG